MTIELTLAACQAPVGDGKPTLASLAETLVDGLAQPSAVQSVPVAYLALGHWHWGKRAEAAYSNRTLSKRLVEIVPAGERIARTGCILAQEIVSYWPDEWNVGKSLCLFVGAVVGVAVVAVVVVFIVFVRTSAAASGLGGPQYLASWLCEM